MEDDFMKKGSILACSITCAMVVGGVIAYFAMPEDLKYKINLDSINEIIALFFS